jgi:hypothetical protein
MEIEELKTFVKSGVAETVVSFGPEAKLQLVFQLRLADQFEIQSDNAANGLVVHLAIPTEDIISLIEIAAAPASKKKLAKSYPCSIDTEFGLHRVEFEVDAFSLKQQLQRMPENNL